MGRYKFVILIFLIPMIAFSASPFDEAAPPSLADRLHVTRSKDPIDGGWLPNITGLPDKTQIMLSQFMIDIIMQDNDPRCKAIDLRLRKMIFQHFVIYQKMLNAQHIYFSDKIAVQWAHVLGMILKESSGDSANITDMRGHSISTYEPKTNLDQWRKILHLTAQTRVQLNGQTNFGLTQTSADRLFYAFRLAQDQRYNTAFLEGREGAATPRKIELNTAIAIRRLIWFYQDFAQGRITQSESRLHQRDINNPEFSERYREGIDMALLYCGTGYLFREAGLWGDLEEKEKLQAAMRSIAYCKLGNAQAGYGINEIDEKCFAEWVTLCPALNIDIATLTPLSYFATRHESPVCEYTFKRLINKKPENLSFKLRQFWHSLVE